AERLAQYRDHNLTLDEIELSLPFSERFIKPVLERLGSLLTARMAKNRQIVVQNKNNLAGRPYALSVNGFEDVKVIFHNAIARTPHPSQIQRRRARHDALEYQDRRTCVEKLRTFIHGHNQSEHLGFGIA